ncbi:MAG: hypothetical protein JWQ45_973 [Blastococcus sp.]|jgi:hypothetical protein|nr:hypothetical protein [Blastococcus sp.]
MNSTSHFRAVFGGLGVVARRGAAAAVAVALAVSVAPSASAAGTAAAAQGADNRIHLRVLVVSNGSPSVEAIAAQLDREGVPYTEVAVGSPTRPTVDAAFLADATTNTARFQAVVLPNASGGGLADAEVTALTEYERAYGIRQVSAYNWPSSAIGLEPPAYSGRLDGGAVTVSAAGLSGPFAYLKGSLAIDDFDKTGTEVYGYLAQPAAAPATGASFTPLLTATVGGVSGVVAGVDSRSGREQLVLTAAVNPSMQWFNQIAHGLVTWMTRGIHLGYQRNYFAVQADDVLMADSRWSAAGNCTPGDGCVDPTVTTKDIRMTALDVARLVSWQKANGFQIDLAFNAGGTAEYVAERGLDPLALALRLAERNFSWINHTYSHPYLGCIQIAPTVQGQSWTCATDAAQTPRQDPGIPGTMLGGTYWASQDFLFSQVQQNIDWARKAGLSDFDATELVTGEHSGLTVSPQQPVDNPFLGAALARAGVRYTASDASREMGSRPVGSATVTVPRHPMNIYYNAGTYLDEVDEYNFYYTRRAVGGGGICEDNPATSTCIDPLPAGSAAQARQSFTDYLRPLEVRNALRYVLTNDPRPFYAHQSNLAEDGILYPVLEGVLSEYRTVYAASAPLVRTDLRTQADLLARTSAWQAASGTTTAYLDSAGVHVPDSLAAVPLTMPAGSSPGTALAPYGGEVSGWYAGAATVAPPTPMGGYLPAPVAGVPSAPAIGTATAGDASATVTWTAPADGSSPVTGYVVSILPADGSTARTVDVPAGATSASVAGLTNGVDYTFTVAATNAVGRGAASAPSNAVRPQPVLRRPDLTSVTAGNRSIAVAWTAPVMPEGTPVTGYLVTVTPSGTREVARSVPAPKDATTLTVTGLTNGTPYTVTVTAVTAGGAGQPSDASDPVVPGALPGAPTIGRAQGDAGSASVSWKSPWSDKLSPVTGYVVAVFEGGGTTPVQTVTVAASASSATVKNLVNGRSYSFAVSAVNAVGAGEPSRRSNPVTPVTVPSAPGVSTVTAARRALNVEWTAPDDGGSPLTRYVLSVYRDGDSRPLQQATLGRSVTEVTVSGLTPGTRYSFTVAAVNAAGTGPASERSVAVAAGR